MKTILDFQKKKATSIKITMITCYDFSFAQLISQSKIDAILVGDSLAQVMHGYSTTLKASANLMALHTRAVCAGAGEKLVVADMPFLSTRKGLKNSMDQVEKLMKAGAHAIKIEGASGHIDLIKHIVESGVPVMGHLGLTPQSIHQLGGPKVQGKDEKTAEKIKKDAFDLEQAGCFSLVLECMPAKLSEEISTSLHIPTIGIGAGPFTDGQILVLQDMLGMNTHFNPKFLKKFLNASELMTNAFNDYVTEVAGQKFPGKEHSYE